MVVGTPDTRLVVLRGNSGSGKTTVARSLQRRRGRGELAVVSQDALRRELLRVADEPGNPAIGLIDVTARYALDLGMSVVVEGILHPARYGSMLGQLVSDHRGQSHAYFWDLPFSETLRRHRTKEKAAEFGEAEMRSWWYGRALAPGLEEQLIGPEASVESVVSLLERECGWAP